MLNVNGPAPVMRSVMHQEPHADACPRQPRFRWPQQAACAAVFGLLATFVVAWACILWSPTHFAFDPFESPSEAVATADPDGVKGLHYHEHGFGWFYTYLRGERFWSNGKPDVFWSSPYGGTYHRFAGWPIYAVWSRVEVLDSQSAGRHSEGQPAPEVQPQRRGWQLPWGEVIHRGVATKDLPVWMHARLDRRVPLIPLPLGFGLDAFIYAVIYLIAAHLIRLAWRIRMHNQTLETNCRPASPLNAVPQFGRAVHARPCVSGGSRSALRSAGTGGRNATGNCNGSGLAPAVLLTAYEQRTIAVSKVQG